VTVPPGPGSPDLRLSASGATAVGPKLRRHPVDEVGDELVL